MLQLEHCTRCLCISKNVYSRLCLVFEVLIGSVLVARDTEYEKLLA